MKKKFVYLLELWVMVVAVQAQILTPVKWKIQLEDSEFAEKTVTFTAMIEIGRASCRERV